jgi:hypothetical protein
MRLGLLLVCGTVVYGGQTNSGVDVQSIIRKSVAVTEADWKEAPKYSFVERDAESKKDRDKTIKTYEVLMIDGSPYNKLIAINDRPLSKEQQQAEDEKLQSAIASRKDESPKDRRRRIQKYEKERAQDEAIMREMADAFSYRLIAEPTMNGREVYQFEANPKPGYVPKTRDTKVLTGMKGMLWVDKETCQWVKVEAQVIRPVSFYGFFAKVGPGTRFELEQEPVAGNVWMPKHFSVKVNATALGFLNEDSTDDETYRDYRPMTKPLEAMR